MSKSFDWCQDKIRLDIFNKQVFCVSRYGTITWYFNGKNHRENGPSIEFSDRTKYWHWCGKLHRVDGPAVEFADGHKGWWLHGRRYSESDYWQEMKK